MTTSLSSRLAFLLLGTAALAVPGFAAAPAPDFVAPKIEETVEPLFPPGLKNIGFSTGDVEVAVEVSPDGKLLDHLVTAYTRKPFADAVAQAIGSWTFGPAYDHGQPVGWVRTLSIHFRTQGMTVLVDNPVMDNPKLNESIHAAMERNNDSSLDYRTYALRDLDRIPKPLHVVAPKGIAHVYKSRMVAGGFINSGQPIPQLNKVVIAFYIDEDGHVRLPGVLTADDAEAANSALNAVRQWQFDPPTRNGQPVLVRVTQAFQFEASSEPSAAAPSR